MARHNSWWTVIISLLVGVVGTSIFWLYSPYGHDRLAHEVAEDLKDQELPMKAKGSALNPRKMASQALGQRFELVTEGRQVFLVDTKNGRVWRYFHQTKEEGFSKDDEGFLPLALYYGGRKHFAASEVEAPLSPPGNPGSAASEAKSPQ